MTWRLRLWRWAASVVNFPGSAPMHRARRLHEDGKHHGRQRPQRRTLHRLEEPAHPLARRAVNARVRRVLLPPGEEKILRRQTLKAPSLHRVVLRILYPTRLHLALVPGHGRLGRQNRRAAVPGELLQLGIEVRIKPVGPEHARLQGVEHHRRAHAAEMPERILQTPDETLGRLPPHRLSLPLARRAQHPPEQMRPPTLPALNHPRARAEIHLQLLAWFTLHPAQRQLRPAVLPAHKPAHRVIAACELMFHHPILINPLPRQAGLKSRRALLPPRITPTGRPRMGSRAGLRGGWFCRAGRQVFADRGPVQRQFARNPALGPTPAHAGR